MSLGSRGTEVPGGQRRCGYTSPLHLRDTPWAAKAKALRAVGVPLELSDTKPARRTAGGVGESRNVCAENNGITLSPTATALTADFDPGIIGGVPAEVFTFDLSCSTQEKG